MKNCSNCEYCISEECAREIMKDNGYNLSDQNSPKAGDCVLGYNQDNNVCKNHRYPSLGLNTYALYDKDYLGPGYFIITEYNEEIIKFVKIYQTSYYGFPNYRIRGYEVGETDTLDKKFREIEIKVEKDSKLFDVINAFAKRLNNDIIFSVDPMYQGKNYLAAETYKNDTFLILVKDVFNCNTSASFIDVDLGDYLTCNKYEDVLNLFNDLAKISQGKLEDRTMKKLLKISK